MQVVFACKPHLDELQVEAGIQVGLIVPERSIAVRHTNTSAKQS